MTVLEHSPNATLLALDEMRLSSQATPMRVWAARGQTPCIPLLSQRDWVVFYGALDVRTGREIALPAPTTNRIMTANFLMVLLMLFPHDPLIILLDNASWHWGGDVQLLLLQNPRLHLLYLPTACPDLNPQEQVWKAARFNVSHNHLYPDLTSLTDAMEAYLAETPFNTAFLDRFTCPN
jgi:transposase